MYLPGHLLMPGFVPSWAAFSSLAKRLAVLLAPRAGRRGEGLGGCGGNLEGNLEAGGGRCPSWVSPRSFDLLVVLPACLRLLLFLTSLACLVG
jgi:hypothetical protein